MRQTQREKGFILLLVIALIPLLGMASIVLTANSRQILTHTRRAALKTQARLACESGIVWLKKNETGIGKDQPLVLEIDHEKKTIICMIELASQTDQQSRFTITGRAEDKRFSYEHSQPFTVKH